MPPTWWRGPLVGTGSSSGFNKCGGGSTHLPTIDQSMLPVSLARRGSLFGAIEPVQQPGEGHEGPPEIGPRLDGPQRARRIHVLFPPAGLPRVHLPGSGAGAGNEFHPILVLAQLRHLPGPPPIQGPHRQHPAASRPEGAFAQLANKCPWNFLAEALPSIHSLNFIMKKN